MLTNDSKTLLYLTVGLIDSLVYIPLIISIFKNPYEAVKSNNYYSWLWWSFSGFIIVVYMSSVIEDKSATMITFLNFIACLIILIILTVYKIKSRKIDEYTKN